MTKKEIISYWIKSAECDFVTMTHLLKSKDYLWALFIGHLVVEKLLKAYHAKYTDINIPYIHDLLRIAEKASLKLSKKQKSFLDSLSDFNIEARYPDYKLTLYKKCDREFAAQFIREIKEFKEWLLKVI